MIKEFYLQKLEIESSQGKLEEKLSEYNVMGQDA